MENKIHSSKIAETIQILVNHGSSLCSALANAKYLLDPELHPNIDSVAVDMQEKAVVERSDRPRAIADSSYNSLNKTMLKRFPDMVSDLHKVSGYQKWIGNVQDLNQEIKPYLKLIRQAKEFSGLSAECFYQCQNLTGLSLATHHTLILLFVDLYTIYVRVQLLVNEIGPNRKILLSSANYFHKHINGESIDDIEELVEYIYRSDKPWQLIQEDVAECSRAIAEIAKLISEWNLQFGQLTIEMIRKDTTFSVINNTKSLVTDDLKLKLLPVFNKEASFIILAAVTVPSEIIKYKSCTEHISYVLKNNHNILLNNATALSIASAFDAAGKSNPKVLKIKSMASDRIGENFANSARTHSKRREYLKFSLNQLYFLIKEKPFLLGHKMPLIEAMLKTSQQEIAWFLAHNEKAQGSKSLRSNTAAQDSFDISVYEMINWMMEIKGCILEKDNYLKEFYVKVLQLRHAPLLEKTISELKNLVDLENMDIKSLEYILRQVQDANAENDFLGLRLNFLRLISRWHSSGSTISANYTSDIFSLLNEIYIRSRYIDSIDAVLSESCSLDFLYYYRVVLREFNTQVLKTPSNNWKFLSVVPGMAQEFLGYSCGYFESEISRVVKNSVKFLQGFFSKMTLKLRNSFKLIVEFEKLKANQILSRRALDQLDIKRSKKTGKKSNQQIEPNLPGYESEMKDFVSSSLKNEHQARLDFQNLLVALSKQNAIFLANVKINVRSILEEEFLVSFKHFLKNGMIFDDVPTSPSKDQDEFPFLIKKPSEYLNELQAHLDAISLVDEVTGFGFVDSYGQILQKGLDIQNARACFNEIDSQNSSKARKKTLKQRAETSNFYLVTYISWYVEYLKDRATIGSSVYSPHRKSIVSKAKSVLRAENYTDPSELMALAKLIGPSGVRMLDERILISVFNHVNDLKTFVRINWEFLHGIKNVWMFEGKLDESVRRMKNLDEMFGKMINLGLLLEFRKMSYEALSFTIEQNIPILSEAISNAHEVYDSDFQTGLKVSHMAGLASYIGMIKKVDKPLNDCLFELCRDQINDRKVFEMLPYLFGVFFRMLATNEGSRYVPRLDALENNGHCLATCVVDLLRYMLPPDGTEKELNAIHTEFIKATSGILQNFRNSAVSKNSSGLNSSYLVLNRVICKAEYYENDIVEEFLPHSVVMSMRNPIFKKKNTNKTRIEVGANAAEPEMI